MVSINPSVTQGLTGGEIKRQEITLFSDRLPKDNPLILRAAFPQFKRITKAELHVTLSATNDLPLFGWRLTEIRVNDKTFIPSNPLRSKILIQNIPVNKKVERGQTLGTNDITVGSLHTGENRFEIFRDAPFGTGVIGDQIFSQVKIILEGEQETNPLALGAGALSSISSNIKNFEFLTGDKIKSNTPLAITLLVISAIIIIGLAIILTKSRGITSDIKETSQVIE